MATFFEPYTNKIVFRHANSGESTGEISQKSSGTNESVGRVIRGRGAVGSSRLDKFFEPGYNPRLDFDNYDDTNMHHYITAFEELKEELDGSKSLKKKKTKKKKKKKSKKKRDKSKSSSSSSSDSESDQ
jgi:hypothetical protein